MKKKQRTCMILLRRISFHCSEVLPRKNHPKTSSKSQLLRVTVHFSHGCLSRVKQEKETWTFFFKHEHQGCPPSISQDGKLRLPGKKSDLTDCIQSLSQPRTSAPTPIDVAIIDGAAAINMLKPTNTVKTFQEYADLVFIPYFRGQLQHVQRLDIIWDEYVPNSLKATTREKRGRGIRRRFQSLTTFQKNWKEFLRVDENKKELFSFLAEQIPPVEFGDGKQVITTKGEQVLCSPLRFDSSSHTPCNHEEADTRIL